ncbi:hypothetical protein C8R46DRAFT_31620 [Mycena filopes]|nr:hypothetical protein C8R46DRAFT_31620 [Mycena filopes]
MTSDSAQQISVLAVQLFLSLRIWKLSRNIWATGLIINAGGLAFAFGIAMVALMYLFAGHRQVLRLRLFRFNDPSFAQFTVVTTRVITSLALGFTMLASLLILLALTQYSTKSSTSRGSSALERFDNICLYLLPRGLVGTALWLGCLLVFVLHPGKIYWVALYFMATKFSINSLLHLLISHQSFRGKGFYEEEPVAGCSTKHRTGQSSIGPFTTVSAIFASDPALTIDISRTIQVESDGAGDSNLRKGGYDSNQMEGAIGTIGDKH